MEQQRKTVPVGDLKNINNVLDLNIPKTQVLIQLIEKESKIIMPDSVGMAAKSTAKIIKVGDNVVNCNVGDIVVDLKNESTGVYYYKKGKDSYMITDQYNLLLWTSPDNYTVD